jgi:hypothetical protein
MRTLMRRLGEGVGVALGGLGGEREDEALASLAYIQQVLSGALDFRTVDPERVLGTTEYARRKEERERVAREQAEREREQAERDAARLAQEREQHDREKERQRQKDELERQMAEQDPLQASPSVRPAVLQTSPPRVRTTRAPWERSEHVPAYPPARTPPVQQKHVSRTQPRRDKAGPSDPLGLGPLG